jgi:hypothetical protein
MGALVLQMRSDLRQLPAQPYADRLLELRFNVNPRYGPLDDHREQTLLRLEERLAAVPGVEGVVRQENVDSFDVEVHPADTVAGLELAEPQQVRGIAAPAGYIEQAQFSPDGHWIAYNADENGRHEVYVTAFPSTGERWQVSEDGGVQPVWRQDGRELYYLGLDGVLKAVALQPGDRPQFSVPSRLFDTGLAAPSADIEQYAVGADGQRFLILKPLANRVRNSVGVILNWPALLQAGPSR